MSRLSIIALLLLFFISSCSSNESALQEKWKFVNEITAEGATLDDKHSELGMSEVVYEFYDKNKYSKQGRALENSLDKLLVSKGEWKLDKVKKDTTEILKLILREEQVNGILEMELEVVKLDDKELIWKDKRNNKFYFTKIEND